jgi:3-oxoacyl-[acyl-carrier protein] reductase
VGHADMEMLEGQVAIVTGAATGIGAATAAALARRGAKVLLNYRSSVAEAERTVEDIRAQGGEARTSQADVAQDADCRRLVASALETWGRLDIVVNNAGTTKFAAHDYLDALSGEDFASIYATNVIGPFQMIRAARDHLKAYRGRVVNVSSIAGILGVGSSIAYAATKGALNTLTLSLARALAPEIRVNAVCPGYVATEWFSRRFGEEGSQRIAAGVAEVNPLKQVASPGDIANAIIFLAGPESGQVTGETLLVDSGAHLALALASRR